MNDFILTNSNKHFVLSCNENVIAEKMFIKENEAIAYFKAFITSFPRSFLTIKTSPMIKTQLRG